MTTEKANKDFNRLTAANGFTDSGIQTPIGCEVYSRKWSRKVQVAWYGESTDTLMVRIWMQYGIPMVWVIRNGQMEDRIRSYTSPKRAMNAIAEIVRFAGYEM